MRDRCARCGKVGEDRRTLWMACFYAMDELDIPFKQITICDDAGTNRGFFSLRVCKTCRASWMDALEKWFKATEWEREHTTGTGVFVRKNGVSVELNPEEVEQWKSEHGGAEPVRVVSD